MGGRGASSRGAARIKQTMQNRRQQANRNRIDKSIRSYEKQIRKHEDKIRNPEKYADRWKNMSPQEREGLLKHWQHEIETQKNNIRKAEELKKGIK